MGGESTKMRQWGSDLQMNSRLIAAVIAYLLAVFSAVLLFRRGYNWRFKFLVAVVGLMPLYEVARLLARYRLWHTPISGSLDQMVELIIAALFLAAVLLLDIESTDRRCMQARLRLAEAEAGWRSRVFQRRGFAWLLKLKQRSLTVDKTVGRNAPIASSQEDPQSGGS